MTELPSRCSHADPCCQLQALPDSSSTIHCHFAFVSCTQHTFQGCCGCFLCIACSVSHGTVTASDSSLGLLIALLWLQGKELKLIALLGVPYRSGQGIARLQGHGQVTWASDFLLRGTPNSDPPDTQGSS